MSRRRAVPLPAMLALACLGTVAFVPCAARSQGLYSPVVSGVRSDNRAYTTSTYQVRPDGTGYQTAAIAGDLSRVRMGGQRYMLGLQTSTFVPPDGSQAADMVACPESGGTPIDLTVDHTIVYWGKAIWSNAGTRVAFRAQRMDPATWQPLEQGLFVADVRFDGNGAPMAIANEKLIAPDLAPVVDPATGNTTKYSPHQPSWSAADDRVVFGVVAVVSGPGGATLYGWGTLYVAYAGTPAVVAVSLSGLPPSTSGQANDARDPKACPVDGRVAFHDQSSRRDIWTVNVPPGYGLPGYAGPATLAATRVTNPTSVRTVLALSIDWSPDGTQVAWDQTPNSGVSRIKADGTGKPVAILTAKQPYTYSLVWWRP